MGDTPPGSSVIAAILRYDAKITTYKIALLRALNEVVLGFPDRDGEAAAGRAIAVPLRLLADRWVAFYWPFVAPGAPIKQGQMAVRGGSDGTPRNDLSFRPALTELRTLWEAQTGSGSGRASDGFFLVGELYLARKRGTYSPELLAAYGRTITAIEGALQMPIRYAGPPGQEYTVFARPRRLSELDPAAVAPLPGAQPTDRYLCVPPMLWLAFRELSLYVEALCVHEWALFTERLTNGAFSRGDIYTLLTDRPDNRRPLSWERNQVEILMMEGRAFTCPWSEKRLSVTNYDLDHVVPVSVYAINALWNLVPSDPRFNSHVKRDRLPSAERLEKAEVHLVESYRNYRASAPLGRALAEDAAAYFAVPLAPEEQPAAIARAAAGFVARITAARNLPTF